MDKQEFPAVYQDDLLGVLEKVGLAEALNKGDLRCAFCDKVLSKDNIGAIFFDEKIKLSCDEEKCTKLIKPQE